MLSDLFFGQNVAKRLRYDIIKQEVCYNSYLLLAFRVIFTKITGIYCKKAAVSVEFVVFSFCLVEHFPVGNY